MALRIARRHRGHGVADVRFFPGAERVSRSSQFALNVYCERVRPPKHTTRGPFYLLERRNGLAEIVERRAVDLA